MLGPADDLPDRHHLCRPVGAPVAVVRVGQVILWVGLVRAVVWFGFGQSGVRSICLHGLVVWMAVARVTMGVTPGLVQQHASSGVMGPWQQGTLLAKVSLYGIYVILFW